MLTTIRVVPVLPDCATRPQDGPGAERERERERVRSAFAQVRGHAVFTKRLTIQTLLTCRRERDERVNE